MKQTKSRNNEEKQVTVWLSRVWPWIAIVAVIIAAAVIRSRLLSVPFERDEGEYAYIAQQMLKGVPPYVSAYSMKLPGIYVVYALIMALFGQTHTAIHLGLLIFNAATIFVIFLLARKFFGPLAAVVAGGVYAVMSMTGQVYGLWANAEHFVVLPALAGLLLICKAYNKIGYVRLLAAGLLLGLAFITKQHGIFFVLFAALYLLYSGLRDKPIKWIKVIVAQIVFAAGAITPFVLVCFLFWRNGTFDKFWFWTFTYARKYATSLSLSDAWRIFNGQIHPIVREAFYIYLFAAAGLLAVVVVGRYRQGAVFTIGLLVFSFLAVCPGFYFRGHYFIFILPAVAILAGAAISAIDVLFQRIIPVILRVFIIGVLGLGVTGYTLYLQRVYLFDNLPETVCGVIYGANPFPESLRIAEFIRNNTGTNDTVAVVGSEPQIYFYSGRRSATSYIYMYPLMELNSFAGSMQEEMITQIETAKPKFMVFVNVNMSWLAKPSSNKTILKWFESYCPQFYDLAGVVNIMPSGPTVYLWNEQTVNYTPASEYWVSVFKRRH
jgi:4-amino-4-deoxy-L-arabinose transferase-like glycosyltransferase